MSLNVGKEVAVLQRMTVKELLGRYADVFGEETRGRNKPWLVKRIAWRMQAQAEGDLSERARQRAAELAELAAARGANIRAAPSGDGSEQPALGCDLALRRDIFERPVLRPRPAPAIQPPALGLPLPHLALQQLLLVHRSDSRWLDLGGRPSRPRESHRSQQFAPASS